MKKIEIIYNCKKAAHEMRSNALNIAYSVNQKKHNIHFGSSFSIIDILATLYIGIMNIDPNNITSRSRDRFILSKGHGALALYSALYVSKIISEEDFCSFYQNGGDFPAHPVMNINKGIEFSSGSLGLGLSLGIGSALAGRINKLDYNVYILMGNGECNEGTVWEAAMFAKHNKLSNLTVIIDNNSMQSDGNSNDILSYDVESIWRGFGWNVVTVNDGNDISQLYDALVPIQTNLPRVIIAKTVKGKGISFMENNGEWHHNKLNQEQFELASQELIMQNS
ncbi:MAG TPA: transketolase [Prolixibacteraceae bacterium]